MIEKIVQDYLSNHLTVPVKMEIPKEKTQRFVVIEKAGSRRENCITSSTIAIQSYGGTLLEAAELNEEVKAVMDGIIDLPEISWVELNTDYNYTDTAQKRYRYQAVYDLVHY